MAYVTCLQTISLILVLDGAMNSDKSSKDFQVVTVCQALSQQSRCTVFSLLTLGISSGLRNYSCFPFTEEETESPTRKIASTGSRKPTLFSIQVETVASEHAQWEHALEASQGIPKL